MGKIPVGRTIGQAYSFSFRKYLTLLGIVWLPMLVLGALLFLFMMPFLKNFADMFQQFVLHPKDPTFFNQMNRQFGWMWLSNIVMLLVFVMIKVGITKELLGLRTGPRFVYLSFGKDELYVILNYIIVIALFYAAIIALAIVVALIAVVVAIVFATAAPHFDPKTSAGPIVAVVALTIVAIECAFFYGFIRLTYLMVPVTVVEKRVGIGRSWELTRGNFWRIFGITLAIWLPLIVLEFLLIGFAIGPHLAAILSAAHKGPDAVAAEFAALWKIYFDSLPYIWIAGFVVAPVFYGLFASPSVFAYRALVPEKIEQPAA